MLVFLSTKGDAFALSSSHGTIYGFIISGRLRTTSLSVSIPALCPKVDMTTLSNYCSSSAASRHLRTILPGRRNERIEHVGQVERALKTTATIGKRTNRKKCRRKSMVWTKKGGSLKKIEPLGWMLMLSEEKEDMGIGEFGAGVLGSGGTKTRLC